MALLNAWRFDLKAQGAPESTALKWREPEGLEDVWLKVKDKVKVQVLKRDKQLAAEGSVEVKEPDTTEFRPQEILVDVSS